MVASEGEGGVRGQGALGSGEAFARLDRTEAGVQIAVSAPSGETPVPPAAGTAAPAAYAMPWHTRLACRLLYRLAGRLPLRVIAEASGPYLERMFVARRFGVTVYLHRFVASDPDRGLHDHPWSWAASFVLAGSYREIVKIVPPGVQGADVPERERRVRFFNFLRGHTRHRVLLAGPGDEVWTLFVHHWKNSKTWGFERAPSAPLSNASGENRRDWWTKAPRAENHPQRVPLRH